jgi:hypothetical protein
MIELPIAWILATIGTLSGAIAALAGIMWGFMKSRLAAQDRIIETQGVTISKLQDDVERMAKGCGHDGCLWRPRL